MQAHLCLCVCVSVRCRLRVSFITPRSLLLSRRHQFADWSHSSFPVPHLPTRPSLSSQPLRIPISHSFPLTTCPCNSWKGKTKHTDLHMLTKQSTYTHTLNLAQARVLAGPHPRSEYMYTEGEGNLYVRTKYGSLTSLEGRITLSKSRKYLSKYFPKKQSLLRCVYTSVPFPMVS